MTELVARPAGYQSVDRLSDIDEFEESFKYLSVVDKTKCYYTLCKATIDTTPMDTPPPQSPARNNMSSGLKTAQTEGPQDHTTSLHHQPHEDEGIVVNNAHVESRQPEQSQGTHGCRIQTPGLLLGLVIEFSPLLFTKPWVFSFSHPWSLSCPGFLFLPHLAVIQP